MVSHGQAELIRYLLLDLAALPCHDFEVIVTLNISEDDATMLKPQHAIFDMIDEMFKDTNIVFLDDSSCNFQCTLTRPNWTNVLYCGVSCKPTKNMHMINEINTIQDILENS